ncbi:MAG TPA: rhodanese-related sulfurtransferase [Candidatus Saccharimonadales bacterium]|nr:rhodanese-related sulfurtransferase [Candidatus Saccharimonadales bacterium]
MQKVILYYKFVPIKDPESVRLWQKSLCQGLNLRGRIIISEHGINGTLGGDIESLKRYIKETKTYNLFKATTFKWSSGSREDFPRLSVKVREEIVTFGVKDLIEVDEAGIKGGGRHLKPAQVHELVKQRGDDVVFFDGRNAYEAAIGRFKDAVVPDVKNTRDFPAELDDPKYDELKKKPVVTYCTGGIRCEVLSMIMKKKGFEEVYQIDGGIVKYGQEYGDDGLWEGSLYVFDGRMATKFTSKSRDIGQCTECSTKTSNFENCAIASCNRLVLVCKDCFQEADWYCQDCQKSVMVES